MNNELIMALSKAHAVWGPLGHLRGNRTGHALELLEVSLDGAIIWLHRLAETLGAEDREHALGTLRGIRDYRRVHPRLTETGLSTLDQKTVADSLKLQEQARRILDEIK
jgi:hypothetical protein